MLAYTLIPVAAATVGGGIAAWRTPGPKLKSVVQHFAAGVVFAAAAGELLPDLVHEKSLPATIIGGAFGVAVMLAVKQLVKKASGSISLIATVGVDVLIDGLIIGIGFAAGAKEGILLTIALTIEILFLSLSVSTTLSQANASRTRVMITTLGIALLLPLGAVIGSALLGGLSGFSLATFLAFGLVALLYLVTEELLVEAHEIPDTPLTVAIFFVGFLVLIVIEEMLQ
ncbi:ZIP family metal transporter [Brasilonema bromeliae]|uniref:ZIP family metal transporter n=1 Tax=Brasilonema bromeliae TaxID=383615 RepID=UPI0030DA29B3